MTNYYLVDGEVYSESSDFDYIMHQLVSEWQEYFTIKAQDYRGVDGSEPHRYLGEPGQFSDIWRKIPKLKKALWDGDELVGEGKRVILMDLIGHCFLTLALIDYRAAPPPKEADCPKEVESVPRDKAAGHL